MGKKTKKRDKITIVFDEEKRRDFLTGFRKRKLERKKKAQEKFEKELLEERKRIKKEAKESYKKLVTSHRPIPELEKYIQQEYEEEDVTVKVFDFSTNANNTDSNQTIVKNEGIHDSEDGEEVPGMELKRKVNSAKKGVTLSLSKKDIKKAVKQEATKSVKKSKIFQRKNKLEKQKAKKKSLQLKRDKLKNSKTKGRNNNRKNFKSSKE